MVSSDNSTSRRRFLRLLAASPLLSVAGLPPGLMDGLLRSRGNRNDWAQISGPIQDPDLDQGVLVSSVEEALNVFDLEKVAQQKMFAQHYDYLATGVDDDSTQRMNRVGFLRYQLRMRPLVDVSRVDMSVEMFGAKWNSPLVLCPAAAQMFLDGEGELATARAAKAKGTIQTLASGPSYPVEEVNEARGEPVWFQLYARGQWPETIKKVKRVETSGCPVLVWTVDNLNGNNREKNLRNTIGRSSNPECSGCHTDEPYWMTSAMAEEWTVEPKVTYVWDDVKRLKDATPMKLVIKGIQTREDAEKAIELGADGIWVSNHGGRAGASIRSTIETMPEISAGVAGRVPIIFDSGVRRGTDMFKALALGATAIGIGRSYLYGLGAFGQAGVEATIDILRRELNLVMRQTGRPTIAQIKSDSLVDRLA